MSLNSRSQWKCPTFDGVRLRLYNSFTKKKEIFVPLNDNEIRWYTCGPTVYDTSHMGHARSYISFDILRRVLQDYFGYNVVYCMNVTDIDDKIIKRTRERYLYKQYIEASDVTLEKIIDDCHLALKYTINLKSRETDTDKQTMYDKQITTVEKSTAELKANLQSSKSDHDINLYRTKLLTDSRDILSSYFDSISGQNLKLDNSIFLDLARLYESEYHNDMFKLNILPPDILTRVSEYVDEIIPFIQKIIDNGYAYVSNNSVYFDTIKFNSEHTYAKLEPDRTSDLAALAEGEGVLSGSAKDEHGKIQTTSEKRNNCDFVLWKKSKQGEPLWTSPWGEGRPGWHIECSVMASSILGKQFDIHTGGVDLKFPHHDNEIAQAEAYYNHDQWVNYFLHSGHLTICGCKMSKSLKNFITINQALEKYSNRQIRLLFLLHSWSNTLDFSDNGMDRALTYEKLLNEFFLNVKTHIRNIKLNDIQSYKKFDDKDKQLNEEISTLKREIHVALCDSINTAGCMDQIRQMISLTNTYMNSTKVVNALLIRNIASYITRILSIFGLTNDNSGDQIGFGKSVQNADGRTIVDVEQIAMPYVEQFSNFRDSVRKQAIIAKNKEILTLCDHVRDAILPDLGVRLEDGGEKTAIKFCDPEILRKEREQALLVEKSKQEEKERRKLEQQAAKEAKEAKKKASKDKKNVASSGDTASATSTAVVEENSAQDKS
ncbi:unnamed protein product [Didymodactylos carnosus]|uniref:Cysteine--tRNA ligase, cytoplasmic n=2 Tax=Didymodactylos carnosus TaxID=1234261 RepID=A0A814BCL8_9BILA|nr:unnamed protein product [Didymodactylos carnosus]CAF3705839.1 unnamed protein product [Didymodactylos carnosus]